MALTGLKTIVVFNGAPFDITKSSAIYGDRGKPIYYFAEQEDVTELESLRMKQRLLVNPCDPEAGQFFDVLGDYKKLKKTA